MKTSRSFGMSIRALALPAAALLATAGAAVADGDHAGEHVGGRRGAAAQQQGSGSAGEQAGTGSAGQQRASGSTAEQQGTGSAAQQQGTGTRATGQERGAQQVLDVQDLLSNAQSYAGQTVQVAGEIEERKGPRSFVLESGGIFEDEVLIVVPQDANVDLGLVKDDADLVVTGTVRRIPVVEIERELGWDLDPEIEVELERTDTVIVARKITRQRTE